MFILTTFIG